MHIEDNMLKELATQLVELKKNIVLIYAFNGTGKTRLSVEYKNKTKAGNNGNHTGVYYNAYSEDLFVWDNDEINDGVNVRLQVIKSSLNEYHATLDEENLRAKLKLYKPKFDFRFNFYKNVADGIESIQFFLEKKDIKAEQEGKKLAETEDLHKTDNAIKISRGEEQIFIWCFFLTLFDIEGWTGDGKQSGHFFIDDPVSSLDDHNIFVTASSLMNLIDQHFKTRKIIITTHHFYFFSILADWLMKGEKSGAYKKQLQGFILKKNKDGIELVNPKNDVFLYHLELLQTIKRAIDEKQLYAYHFALLRQVLENISSFLGVRQFSYVLEQIGITDKDEIAMLTNTMSHKNVFRYEAVTMVEDNEQKFIDIFDRIQSKYNFVLHAN